VSKIRGPLEFNIRTATFNTSAFVTPSVSEKPRSSGQVGYKGDSYDNALASRSTVSTRPS
jgi:hypothetical protein